MYVRKPEKCTLQKPYFKVRRNLNVHLVYTNFVTVGDGNFAKYMLHCIRHCDFFQFFNDFSVAGFFLDSILLAEGLV